MIMSNRNTFMSNGTINENAESPELERGAWPVVARKQRGRSSYNMAQERGISLRQAYRYLQGACARPCDAGWRTVGAGDIQDSSRRACTTSCVFQAQRFAAECDCYRGYREAFDRNKSTRKTWLSALQSVRQFVWNLLSIAYTPSNCNRSMSRWLRTAFVQ
jgi:hypothetical protein